MLSTKNLCKSYGTLKILNGVSIEVAGSEIGSITGASGAGKSTLLHVLGTLDRPDSGQLIIDGTDVFKLSDTKLSAFRNRKIGFVFQFHHLLPEFTALENVCMPALIAGESMEKAKSRAMMLLDRLGLTLRYQHKPGALSGGEQQRIAMARALINQPSIVLADEPTGNLDSKNSLELFEMIQALRDEFKQTFILVTHNEELAAKSDRILHMVDGKTL
ncbi:MAG TPA: lipoprotein-releasing system ATP-binding protein LolD [Chitinophagaceae bacterium]|nr:lipoprotein-releasing system ATP-binding protein LolD [Chitinophagaceae bacterium]